MQLGVNRKTHASKFGREVAAAEGPHGPKVTIAIHKRCLYPETSVVSVDKTLELVHNRYNEKVKSMAH